MRRAQFIRRLVCDDRVNYQFVERIHTGPRRSRLHILADIGWYSTVEMRIGILEHKSRE
jgi:hypothetical protein